MLLDGSFYTKVVGVTFKNDDGSDRQRIIRNLSRDGELEEGTELFFVPQPTNPYDSNCVLVNAGNGQTLGTLSRDVAAQVSPQIRQGYTFKAYVSAQTGGDIGYAYGINIKVERYKNDSKVASTKQINTYKANVQNQDRHKIAERIYQTGARYREEGKFKEAKKQFVLLREYPDVYRSYVVDSLLESIEEKNKEEERVGAVRKKAREKYQTISPDEVEFDVVNHLQDRSELQYGGLYPHVMKLKDMFAAFFPVFQTSVVRDEDSWRMVNTNHMFWANEALQLKRQGKYVESCQLYFQNILSRGEITLGWAQGIFKTLACAGDIADALAFGREWFNYADLHATEPDTLLMHFSTLLRFVQNPETDTNMLPQYLQSISGNPNYTIDVKKTDLYTDEVLRKIRCNV